MDNVQNPFALIYSLSAPFYFILALVIPIIIVYAVMKTIRVYSVLASPVYKKRLLSLSLTFIASMFYVESHFIGAVLDLLYIPYGIDNLFAIAIFISAYVAVESYLSIARRYDPLNSPRYVSMKRALMSLLVFCCTVLGVASLFVGHPIYDSFVMLFGLGFVPFLAMIFYILWKVYNKLDYNSKRQIFWTFWIVISFGLSGFVDTIFDIVNFPVYLNMVSIPASFVGLYSVYKVAGHFIETEKERSN